MKLYRHTFTIALAGLLLLVSCDKENTTDQVAVNNNPTTTRELQVPANFNFATLVHDKNIIH